MKRILIADDSKFMRFTIRTIIDELGYKVVAEAENGEEAIAKYAKFKPDIVLMDITMPKVDGIEATRRIKRLNKNAKVVIISAMSQQRLVIKAIDYGAADFIVKPFKKKLLKKALRKL